MTILIVEDDEHTRRIYRDALENHGYTVITAAHGAEGVAMARRRKPDLILLDIRMPVMDGMQAMHYLKFDPDTERIPIFAISGFADPTQPQSGSSKMGFDLFLVKPLELNSVIAAIEQRIGPPTPRADA